MKDEYNSDFYKKIKQPVGNAAEEFKTFDGNAEAEEAKSFAGNAEASELPSGESKKVTVKTDANVAAKIGNIAKCFLTVATVAVSAVAVAEVAASANVSAEFISLTATDADISYSVTVDGDTDTELVLYNDFTREERPLVNGENTDTIDGLKPNMKYTVAVVYQSAIGERTVIKQSVYTEKYVERISEFYSISHECTCNRDGYFHFTLDFIDENGYWTDFSASLEDEYGNISYCEFTDDLLEEQSIDVVLEADLLGNTATFTLSFKTDSPEHVPDETLFVYNGETQSFIYTVKVKI